jgi:hypothetical protein
VDAITVHYGVHYGAFGLNITDFHLCDRCGIWVAATWRDGDRLFGVINVPALDDRARFSGNAVTVDFDGEDVAAREARRRTNWTPARVLGSHDLVITPPL